MQERFNKVQIYTNSIECIFDRIRELLCIMDKMCIQNYLWAETPVKFRSGNMIYEKQYSNCGTGRFCYIREKKEIGIPSKFKELGAGDNLRIEELYEIAIHSKEFFEAFATYLMKGCWKQMNIFIQNIKDTAVEDLL